MIQFKNSVQCPRSLIILAGASNAASQVGLPGCYVTSANDSQHMPGSKHYTDCALDLRTHGLTDPQKNAWKAAIQLRLGEDYQVVFEDHDGPNEHLHVEYDPLATRKR